jgi:hypothetical protein
VGMLEHALNARAILDSRCRNRRSELDDYSRFRNDDADDGQNRGPYFLYMVVGKCRM